MLDGKYKLKQNENGYFTLYHNKATDWCYLATLPPPPEHLDLDEVVWQAEEKIHELDDKMQPLAEADSELARNIWKIQVPPEGLPKGQHPTVEVTDMDWKKGEHTQKYLTSLEWQETHFSLQHEMCNLPEYCMMAVQMKEMAWLGQQPHQFVYPTRKMFMVVLQPADEMSLFFPF